MPVQVPLILAWALSIHKSQGQTLERVKVNLDGIFEKGQGNLSLQRLIVPLNFTASLRSAIACHQLGGSPGFKL